MIKLKLNVRYRSIVTIIIIIRIVITISYVELFGFRGIAIHDFALRSANGSIYYRTGAFCRALVVYLLMNYLLKSEVPIKKFKSLRGREKLISSLFFTNPRKLHKEHMFIEF